jgi:hypothetical protein
MKNKLLLTMALGLAGAAPLMAGTVDVYITGSTAFRANVYTASTKLYSSPPTISYADNLHGGGSQGTSKASSWVMTGTPAASLTALTGNTLVIHGLFTGSIQGAQAVENAQPLTWTQVGSAGGATDTLFFVTNTATIDFSDADVNSTTFPYDPSTYNEEQVCVQPFVIAKSQGGGAVTNISNVSWEQLEYGIPSGRIPLSAWTYKTSDTNTFVYLDQRTKDSGTRRTETAGNYYQFNDLVGIYIYDATNNNWYLPSVTTNFFTGTAPAGVIGSEGPGLGNANLAWGYGYIGGGDIKAELNIANAANEAIGVLSMSDSQGVGPSGINWSNVVSFNGFWPTLAGAGIHATTGTNDYSPITLGYYPLWGYEVIVYPQNPGLIAGQDISQSQLGTQTTPGSFLGVFNSQTVINGGSPLVGSIENEIDISKTPSGSPAAGATAIPLADMVANRANVGGLISPF